MNYETNLKYRPLLTFAVLSLLLSGTSYGKDLNELIKAFCIEGYKNEVIKNKTTVDLRLGEYICDCFVNRINKNESLETAREKCKNEALDKFSNQTI